MIKYKFLFSNFGLPLQTAVLLLIMTQCAMPQSPPEVQQLLKELPSCSVLRAHLEYGIRGDGIEQSYMVIMRQEGVQRAMVEVHAILRGGKPADIHVERRLYFRRFDGPNSQISDEASLKAFEASGLQADLDGIALSRASTAPIVPGVDWLLRAPKRVESFVSSSQTRGYRSSKCCCFD